jgi:hypothetical protein
MHSDHLNIEYLTLSIENYLKPYKLPFTDKAVRVTKHEKIHYFLARNIHF